MKNCRLEKIASSVLPVKLFPNLIVYSCLTDENQLNATIVTEEKADSRGQIFLRKEQVVRTIAEIEYFNKNVQI